MVKPRVCKTTVGVIADGLALCDKVRRLVLGQVVQRAQTLQIASVNAFSAVFGKEWSPVCVRQEDRQQQVEWWVDGEMRDRFLQCQRKRGSISH